MKERKPNILRAGVILMVLTVWMPTAAVLAYPHDNDWVERELETAQASKTCLKRGAFADRNRCGRWSDAKQARVDWDGWIIYGPITLGLLAGLYFVSGSLSLRPIRVREG